MGTIIRAGLNPDLIETLRRASPVTVVAPVAISQPTDLDLAPHIPEPSQARGALKAIARRMLRLARPVLRPLAVRARTYFTAEIREAQFHEIARSTAASAELGRSLDTVRESVLGAMHGIRLLVEESIDSGGRRTSLALNQIHSAMDRLDERFDLLGGHLNQLDERLDVLSTRVDQVNAMFDGLPPVALRLDEESVMIRSRAGFVVCPTNDERLIAGLVDSGDVERGTRLLIERVLAPGDVFVDAGANVGVHTVAAARAVGPNGRVVAFEPFPGTAAMLRRTVALNGFESSVDVHEVALSSSDGEARLHLGSMSGHHSLFDLEDGETGSCDVKVRRLDGVLAPGSAVAVVKIDVEGAEVDVVEGATRTLSDNPMAAIVAEFGPSHLRRVGVSGDDWWAAMLRPGWQWRVIEPLSGRLLACELEDLLRAESSNLLLAHGESDVWRRAER